MRGKVAAVVAESLPAVRDAILHLLRYDLGAEVGDSVDNFEDALELVKAVRPELAVIDRDLPGRDALEAVALVRGLSPHTYVLLLAGHLSETDIVRASKAGVRGYALKSDTIGELRRTMKDALAGRIVFSRGVRKRLLARAGGRHSGGGHTPTRLEDLTEREIQVLTYIAQGLSVKETAAVMKLSPKTVDAHKMSVMGKLDIHDRVLLAHYAIREGLVPARADDRIGWPAPGAAHERSHSVADPMRAHHGSRP